MIGITLLINCLAVGGIDFQANNSLTPEEVDERAYQQRRAITSGVLKIRSNTSGRRGDRTIASVNPFTYHLLFDFAHSSIRADTNLRGINNKFSYSGYEKMIFQYTKEKIDFTKNSQGINQPSLLDIRESDHLPVGDSNSANLVVDPRLIGIVPLDFLNLSSITLAEAFNHTNRTISLDRERLGDSECYKVKLLLNGTSTVFWRWIDPAKDYSVVKAETIAVGGAKNSEITTINSELKFFELKKIWFPVKTTFSRRQGDMELTEETNLDVEKINDPIDSNLFSPISLDIPPGTRASYHGSMGPKVSVWDGKRLVFVDSDGQLPNNPRFASWKILLIVNGIVCFIVFIFLMRRGFLLKRKKVV